MEILSFARIIFKNTSIFILTVLAIIFGVFTSPVLITLYIWRFVVKLFAKSCRPHLQKMLTCKSSFFAADDMYSRPKCAIVCTASLDGEINLAKARKLMARKLNARDEHGNLTRPELKQFVVQWMGYYCWKQETNFCIENHVSEYSGLLKSNAYDDDLISKIGSEITAKPFVNYQSPWHLYVFRNFKKNLNDRNEKPTSCVILHIHHCLADGFSLLNMLPDGPSSSEGALTPLKVNTPKMALWKKGVFFLTLPILVFFKSIQATVDSYDSNELHIPEKVLSGYVRAAKLDKVPVDYIKEIKDGHGVSFTSVILAALAGGLRNFMLENGIKVPRNMHGIIPIPVPDHPEKLRNHMTIGFVTLPVGISEPRKRLLAIHRKLSEFGRSTAPHVLFLLLSCIGALPSFLIRPLTHQRLVSVVASIFAGPSQQIEFLGKSVLDVTFGFGTYRGNIGIGYFSMSYDGFVSTTVTIDQSLLPKTASVKEDLGRRIAEEFDILWKEVAASV